MWDVIVGAVITPISSFVDTFLDEILPGGFDLGFLGELDISGLASDVLTGAAVSALTGNDWVDGAIAGGLTSVTKSVGAEYGWDQTATQMISSGLLGSGSTGWSLEGAVGGALYGYGDSKGWFDKSTGAGGTDPSKGSGDISDMAGPSGIDPKTGAPVFAGSGSGKPGAGLLGLNREEATLASGVITGLGTGLGAQATADASRANNQDDIAARRAEQEKEFKAKRELMDYELKLKRGQIAAYTNPFINR